MNLSILLPDGNVTTIQLPTDEADIDCTELAIELIAAECGIIPEELQVTLNGTLYSNSTASKLSSMKFSDGDMIKVERNVLATSTPRGINYLHEIPGNIKPEELVNVVLANPKLLTQFQNADPEMHSALAKLNVTDERSADATEIAKTECTAAVRLVMMGRALNNHKVVYEKQIEEQKIYADPFSEASQKRIAEQISQQNIQANMDVAIEEMPEAFARVHMLYVNLEINNTPIKAFVDSGAQSTIMSVRCAERCGLLRLVDKRFAGEARGVGSCKIIGRVHVAQMKLGGSFFSVSLTVLENNNVDFLFGLDMLKRHRCCIDLENNVLRVMGVAGSEEVAFLPEHELPESGTFGKAGLKEDENMKEASLSSAPSASASSSASSSSSSSSSTSVPPAKKNCVESDMKESVTTGGAGVTTSSGDMDDESRGWSYADKVSHLKYFGFPEHQVIEALRQTNGDMKLAAALLMADIE